MRRAVPPVALFLLLVAAAPSTAQAAKRPACVVPKLTGDTLKLARRHLVAAHCTLGIVTKPTGSSGLMLVVRSTSPRAGARRKNKARVSIVLKIKPTASPVTTTPTAPALTTTYLDAQGLALVDASDTTAYYEIHASLSYFNASDTLMYLVGLPVSYSIVDQVTGATVLSFTGTTGTAVGFQGCAIAYDINEPQMTTLTLTGEAIEPSPGAPLLPACFSGTVTVPYSDPLNLDASFAGNSTYAAATLNGPL